jgi:hypothetical protein
MKDQSMLRHFTVFCGALTICFAAIAQKLEGVPLIAASDYLPTADEKSLLSSDVDSLTKLRSRTDRISNVRVSRFNPQAVHANIITVVLPDGTERQYIATKVERIDHEADRLANVTRSASAMPVDPSASSVRTEIAPLLPVQEPKLVLASPAKVWTGKSSTGMLIFSVGDDGRFYGTITEQTNVTEHYRLSMLPGRLLAVQRLIPGLREAP